MSLEEIEIHKAVIITAIPVEFKAVRAHLTDPEEVEHPDGDIYEVGSFQGERNKWTVGVAEVGAGNSQCAMETERVIKFFNPNVVMFVGIAGGIKDVTLGDVVVAQKAYGYESGKIKNRALLTRPEMGESTYGILQRAKAVARKEDWLKRIIDFNADSGNPKVITKPIASGEKVVTSTRSDIYKLIKNNYEDTVAVEMEGYGFYKAIQANTGVQGIIVRGISDLLINKNAADKKGYQAIASRHASAFAFEVLSKLRI